MKNYVICLLFIGILVFTGLFRCPLNYVFGIPCPFCGMTRAFLSLIHVDLQAAFYYHPLWPVVVLVLFLFMLQQLKVIQLSDQLIDYGALIIAILFLVCFIIRHVCKSPVVQIHLSDGLFI